MIRPPHACRGEMQDVDTLFDIDITLVERVMLQVVVPCTQPYTGPRFRDLFGMYSKLTLLKTYRAGLTPGLRFFCRFCAFLSLFLSFPFFSSSRVTRGTKGDDTAGHTTWDRAPSPQSTTLYYGEDG